MNKFTRLVLTLFVIVLALPAADVSYATPWGAGIKVMGSVGSADNLEFWFHSSGAIASCGVWTIGVFDLCLVVVPIYLTDDTQTIAARIAEAINSNSTCRDISGFTAWNNGSIVYIMRHSSFHCMMTSSSEMSACPGGGFLYLSPNCSVNNVCNGADCDEEESHASGLKFAYEEIADIPTLNEWGFFAVVLLLLGAGTLVIAIRRKKARI